MTLLAYRKFFPNCAWRANIDGRNEVTDEIGQLLADRLLPATCLQGNARLSLAVFLGAFGQAVEEESMSHRGHDRMMGINGIRADRDESDLPLPGWGFSPNPPKGYSPGMRRRHEIRSDRDRATPSPTHVIEMSMILTITTRTLPPVVT
jgi:hypothetical protein